MYLERLLTLAMRKKTWQQKFLRTLAILGLEVGGHLVDRRVEHPKLTVLFTTGLRWPSPTTTPFAYLSINAIQFSMLFLEMDKPPK